jgi:hypothetical protein
MWTASNVALGAELPHLSRQWNLQLFRERHELVYGPGRIVEEAWPERNIHDDAEAAKREGLTGAVGSAPQLIAMVHRSMLLAFGPGWLVGGRVSVKMIKPLLVDDFTTVKGSVTGLSLEDSRESGGEPGLRATCRVRVERLDGTVLMAGIAEALVSRP